MAKRVPPGEKPYNVFDKFRRPDGVQQARGAEQLPAPVEEWIAYGSDSRPVQIGDYLDEISADAAQPGPAGPRRVFLTLPESLYQRLKQTSAAQSKDMGEFVRELIKRECVDPAHEQPR